MATMHRSQNLGHGYDPKSRLDLYNPGQDHEANQEVVAFLEWLDRHKHSAVDHFDNPQRA